MIDPAIERVEMTNSVPGASQPVTLRLVRGRRLVHEYAEPDVSAQPAAPQAEAEQ